MQDELLIGLAEIPLAWHDPAQNLRHVERLLDESPDSLNLLLLPEMFTTGFTMNPEHLPVHWQQTTLCRLQIWSEQFQLAIVGSYVHLQDGQYYNRLHAVLPDGKIWTYDKVHLFGYAGEDESYTPGNQRIIFDYLGWKICPLICYDLRFGRISENHSDIDLLLYVANWPSGRTRHWDRLLPARAIENQCYVAACNRTGRDDNALEYGGHSTVLDFHGHPLINETSEQLKIARITYTELDTYRKNYPFVKDRREIEIP